MVLVPPSAMARGNKKNISKETQKHVINLYYNHHRKQVDIAVERGGVTTPCYVVGAMTKSWSKNRLTVKQV
jgi:hypothetical protein